jgi:hypothetical protein
MILRLLSPVFRLSGRTKLQLIPLAVVPQPTAVQSITSKRTLSQSSRNRMDFARVPARSTNQVSS